MECTSKALVRHQKQSEKLGMTALTGISGKLWPVVFEAKFSSFINLIIAVHAEEKKKLFTERYMATAGFHSMLRSVAQQVTIQLNVNNPISGHNCQFVHIFV